MNRLASEQARTTAFLLAAVTSLAAHNNSALAETRPCRSVEYERSAYTICEVDPRKQTIRLYWKRSDGTPYAYLSALPRALEGEAGRLLFATNAGMFDPELLEKLKVRLKQPPPDGGIWTSRKVADFMADQLGLETLAQQRGWEALQAIGWSIQSPRPKNPNSAILEEAKAFKKTSLTRSPRKPTSIPTSRSRSGRRMNIGSA